MEISHQKQFQYFYQHLIKKSLNCAQHGSVLRIIEAHTMGMKYVLDMIQYTLKNQHILGLKVSLPSHGTVLPEDIYREILTHIPNSAHVPIINGVITDFSFHHIILDTMRQDPMLRIALLIDHGNGLLNFPDAFFDNLEDLRYRLSPRLSIFVTGRNELVHHTSPAIHRLFKKEIVYLKPFDAKTSLVDIEMQEKRLDIQIPKKEKSRIVRLSNGHHGTIVYLCQIFAKEKTLKKPVIEQTIINDPLVPLWISEFFHGLNAGQLHMIQFYSEKGILPDPKTVPDMQELLDLGVFRVRGTRVYTMFDLFIPVFQKQLTTQKISSIKPDFSITGNSITTRGVNASTILSPQEYDVLLTLIKKSGTTIPYDTIAKILWKTDSEEKFSMWAINKIISTLRKKLLKFGIPPSQIITVSKRGYMIMNIGSRK